MKPKAKAGGFTLIELLVTVFVLAVVMTAIAAAMSGALENYSHNESVALTTQAGRSVLNRMLSEIRTAQDVVITDAGQGLEIVPGDDINATIHYKISGQRLLFKPAGSSEYHALLGGEGDEVTVVDFQASKRYDLVDPADPASEVYNTAVTVVLEVQANEQSARMEASALVRKNLAY